MNLSSATKLTELAQYIEQNGDVHNRTQLRASPCGRFMSFDETAPIVITRIIRVQLGRAKGYATFDGETLRLDVKGARSYRATLTDNGFVMPSDMGYFVSTNHKGGKLMHTLADWHTEQAAMIAGIIGRNVVRERI